MSLPYHATCRLVSGQHLLVCKHVSILIIPYLTTFLGLLSPCLGWLTHPQQDGRNAVNLVHQSQQQRAIWHCPTNIHWARSMGWNFQSNRCMSGHFCNLNSSNSLHVQHPSCTPQSSSEFYSGQGQILKGQVLSELEFMLGQKEQAIQANPYNSTSQQYTNILCQLHKMVKAGISPDELWQSLTRLHSYSQSNTSPLPVPVPSYPPPAVSTAPPFNTHPFYPTSLYP